jgi:hypothetical protein
MSDTDSLDNILDFWRAYDRLSHEGACDSTGGMQSRRVFDEWLDEWIKDDRPKPVLDEFIRRRANLPSPA